MTILYFGVARDVAGVASDSIETEAGMTVEALWSVLLDRHPELASIRRSTRIAVDMHYADLHDHIPPAAEVAVIPPVAGG